MRVRRNLYLAAMAHLYGYTPAQVDDLDVPDFELLASAVDAYNRSMKETARG